MTYCIGDCWLAIIHPEKEVRNYLIIDTNNLLPDTTFVVLETLAPGRWRIAYFSEQNLNYVDQIGEKVL